MSRELRRAALLFVLTLASMFWVGALGEGVDVAREPLGIIRGYSFALPLMAILLAHELGHYFAARLHSVDTSPPYFIPMPLALTGTFGAVISMRGAIRLRNALFDIGAAGPLAGLVVAVPVLIYGISTSAVRPLALETSPLFLGESLLTLALSRWLKGPIPAGHDLMLNSPALAGWAGLLVTMLNLVPVGQLDGGHVAYALFGPKQDVYSRRVRAALLGVAGLVSGLDAWSAWRHGARGDALWNAAQGGGHWLMWWFVLSLMARFLGEAHPPTEPSELSPGRRVLAWFTLGLFGLLFMPTWISTSK